MPLWPGIALLASGAVIIVAETDNLLLFLGIALALIGIYALMRHRAQRTSSGAIG